MFQLAKLVGMSLCAQIDEEGGDKYIQIIVCEFNLLEDAAGRQRVCKSPMGRSASRHY